MKEIMVAKSRAKHSERQEESETLVSIEAVKKPNDPEKQRESGKNPREFSHKTRV
jgi:hypothetical protein